MERNDAIKSQREKLDITRKEFSDALGFSKVEEKKLKLWEEGKALIPDEIYNRIMKFPTEPKYANPDIQRFTQIDLFAGIGVVKNAKKKRTSHRIS